jgi:hypothetical protein
MRTDQMQRQRFELKYRISPDAAQAVEDIVRRRLKRDHNSIPQGSRGYPVHSLYLDTAAFRLYHSTINGERNRFKLRVRFYDDVPASPVFLEIKRRNNNCISKQRAAVHRTAIPELLLGGWPRPQHLHTEDARQLEAARNFCRLTAELHALPCSHVAYERDAWTSHHDNSVRVTFDRNVRCEPSRLGLISTHLQHPEQVFPLHTVILEIKFTDRFPEWLGDMIQPLGLRTDNAAKYVDGVPLFGPEKFRSRTLYTLVS